MDKLNSLKNLGLTKQQAIVYLLLLKEGMLSAKKIGEKCRMLPNAVYRIIYKLDEYGLIELVSKIPLKYVLTPAEYAIMRLVESQRKELEKSKESILKTYKFLKFNKETDLELSADKIKFFKESERLINQSKKEVLIISIGEPSTPELILADKRAIERGVIIKFIVHKKDPENIEFLQNLKKNGLEIRHLKDWGYHMQITDSEKCLLAVNNPMNTDERANIKIQSSYLSKAFRDYFYLLWEKAEPV